MPYARPIWSIERRALLLQEVFPRGLLVLDDLLDHLAQPVDDVFFLLAERRLVGHLEQVAHRLRALAVEAAHGQADLVHGLDDLVDVLVQHQRGQVQHRRGAHPRADVGRAGGQVAELRR